MPDQPLSHQLFRLIHRCGVRPLFFDSNRPAGRGSSSCVRRQHFSSVDFRFGLGVQMAPPAPLALFLFPRTGIQLSHSFAALGECFSPHQRQVLVRRTSAGSSPFVFRTVYPGAFLPATPSAHAVTHRHRPSTTRYGAAQSGASCLVLQSGANQLHRQFAHVISAKSIIAMSSRPRPPKIAHGASNYAVLFSPAVTQSPRAPRE